jgi:hypothetical protein
MNGKKKHFCRTFPQISAKLCKIPQVFLARSAWTSPHRAAHDYFVGENIVPRGDSNLWTDLSVGS